MKKARSNKLTCIVTGKKLIATKEYYQSKVEKAGSEDELHETYICREAKNLIKQGTSIPKIRQLLDGEHMKNDIPQQLIDSIMQSGTKTNFRRINNLINISNSMVSTSDPDVAEYVQRLKNEK